MSITASDLATGGFAMIIGAVVPFPGNVWIGIGALVMALVVGLWRRRNENRNYGKRV